MADNKDNKIDSTLVILWVLIALIILYLARGMWKNYKANTSPRDFVTSTAPTSIVFSSGNSIPSII